MQRGPGCVLMSGCMESAYNAILTEVSLTLAFERGLDLLKT